jgi:predicted DNA binding CopG/RHH family protein
MKKPWPALTSDEEAERFVAEADLTQYDFAAMVPTDHEYRPKTATVSMRVPQSLLDAVKAEAARAGMPYQRFIRQAMERALSEGRR